MPFAPISIFVNPSWCYHTSWTVGWAFRTSESKSIMEPLHRRLNYFMSSLWCSSVAGDSKVLGCSVLTVWKPNTCCHHMRQGEVEASRSRQHPCSFQRCQRQHPSLINHPNSSSSNFFDTSLRCGFQTLIRPLFVWVATVCCSPLYSKNVFVPDERTLMKVNYQSGLLFLTSWVWQPKTTSRGTRRDLGEANISRHRWKMSNTLWLIKKAQLTPFFFRRRGRIES